MLRPERMSRVSVTGSKGVMDEVVETVHDLRLLHMTEYDGAWEGFDPGNPTEGADQASEKLVTVRSLKSILEVEEASVEERAHPRVLDDEELERELEDVRVRVNELDDRRDDLREELRSVEEELGMVEPFVDLGVDLDLLSGYDSLSVAVGEGDPSAVREALTETPGVEQFELFTGEKGALGVFAYVRDDVDVNDVLVGAQFTGLDIPDVDGSPEGYVSDLRERRSTLESKLKTVQSELEDVRAESAGFLLAAEEQLAIDVQKREAPLSFATTENAFVAEGWIPSIRYDDLVTSLTDAVGDHVEIEKHGEAAYDEDGHPHGEEEPVGDPVATDGGDKKAVSDGGTDTAMAGGAPPVIQNNAGPVKPFEALVEVINRPKYTELDPTFIVFLTFPAFFGFMIGDLGYGILYMALGAFLYTRFDSDMIRSLGGVALWAGGFTALFGVLYGEIFGLLELGEILFDGSPPLHKGLKPQYADYALGWLVVSLLAGVLHLTVGWIVGFYQDLSHGFADAMYENGSWLLMMFGLWAWIFAGAFGSAPSLMYGSQSVFNGNPFELGFTGFPPSVGLAGLAVFAVGLVLLVYGEPIEGVEFLNVLVNVLSYTRLAAVLLAKAGMAFVVNLLFFGVYVDSKGGWHFGTGGMPTQEMIQQGTEFHGYVPTGILFEGLAHGGISFALLGIVILVFGHALVLALGVTSAGLQAVRLEYVEFFGKFYEGGGAKYNPFGYERTYTTED
ncbi:V-type ATP synthase subunit I [Salinirubellus salinus]|uniref:A-type ATP synthase subunit I n=1 Tax=Salinirubellus salinus TaxID=1364945 RepID=A0A9E7U9C2_9EURY|nr:V-type ATP synthase subunit I [Salinirubellus salinus]UWM52907.1 V-type ATP synthase subunit I [Salinirubellus salinus]